MQLPSAHACSHVLERVMVLVCVAMWLQASAAIDWQVSVWGVLLLKCAPLLVCANVAGCGAGQGMGGRHGCAGG